MLPSSEVWKNKTVTGLADLFEVVSPTVGEIHALGIREESEQYY
jgi:hypothetical protein